MSATTTLVIATATFATAFAAVATAAATSLSGDNVDECLNLFLSGIVHAQHLTFKYEVHTSIGMVEVNGHSLILHLYYEAVHTLALSIDEGDNVACINLLVVKFAVYAEDILVYIKYKVVAAVTVTLLLSEGEVEGVAFFQVIELCFECLEGETQSCGELEGLLSGSLLYELLNAFELGIHVV